MKPVVKLTALVISAALLAGCSLTDRAGAAAVVAGDRITNEEVLTDYQGIANALAGTGSSLTPDETNRMVVRYFVLWRLTALKAAEMGVAVPASLVEERYNREVSQAGSVAALEQMGAGSGVAPAELKRYLETLLNLDAISKRLNPTDADAGLQAAVDSLVTFSEDTGIEVSPRYGRWDAAQLNVLADSGPAVVTESQLAEMIAAGIQP